MEELQKARHDITNEKKEKAIGVLDNDAAMPSRRNRRKKYI